MKEGIARKLIRTYFIIVVATLVSGVFCFYVLGVNLRTNSEMRYVTMPSLENLKEMKLLMQEIKKLTNTWVFIANNKDQERLEEILSTDYPLLDSSLDANSRGWTDQYELRLYSNLKSRNRQIIDSIIKITELLKMPESYTNDGLVDNAAELNRLVGKQIKSADRLYAKLIETKKDNLIRQQNEISSLLDSLYVIVLLSVLVVFLVSVILSRYSKKNIVDPILALNKTIMDMAKGEVLAIGEVKRSDEIGQMHNALHIMINGIIQKIHFAVEIGSGNYESGFTLLSEHDKLGQALLAMRNDLKTSNEALVEQERRLVDAQKMARIGNYFYDIETGELESSSTLDDILGIDKNFDKSKINWKDHILPEYHADIAERAVQAIKGRTKFAQNYVIKRYDDGKKSWVNTISEYNYNAAGRAISMFGTIQDVTESKLLELELNNSYKVATEQNNRLLNFSYIVSHNLRMHAVNIHSLLELINESDSVEDKLELIAHLHTTSEQLNETMHHLNDVVAMQNTLGLEIKPLLLSEYISHTTSLLKTKIDEKKALIHNNVPDSVVINYNPAYLDSILLNFLSNAVKYSHQDRTPEVTISCTPCSDSESLHRWVLEIADNGMGIDLEQNKEKLFGMYKTFHGNKDAKGIGLFLTKYQIEAMGGRVDVSSIVNEGTTFRIFIK
jgi:signal transduction histidine kinase